MNLYFASDPSNRSLSLLSEYKANVLLSYYFLTYKKRQFIDFKKKYNIPNLFIDSGAFSAFTKKVFVNIDQYSYYLKNSNYDVGAGLDVIGNAEETYKNCEYMEKQYGLKIMPTFHYGEDFEYLDKYCANHDYVAIGGIAQIGKQPQKLFPWLSKIFTKYPKHKFHGFAVTGNRTLSAFPWYSCDSASWTIAASKGSIITLYGTVHISEQKKY